MLTTWTRSALPIWLCFLQGKWGDTPSQVWMGVSHPRSGQGVSHPRPGWGVPHPAEECVTFERTE